jgi:hypothetical protein
VEEGDGDLMGDGINIAARLQTVAQPGAICLSEDAYRQVKSRLDLAITDLGERKLKNIAEPMRIYSLEVGVRAAPQARFATGGRRPCCGGGEKGSTTLLDRRPTIRQFERQSGAGVFR